MISGPVLPRNQQGLRELIDGHLDQVERGLVVVERDLELESECRVDALAKDAAGRPVFLLLAHPDFEHELPSRVLALRAWLSSSLSVLARFVRHDGLDYELPPRLVVLGFELPPRVLQQLGALRDRGVEVHQFCSIRIGGRERGGVVAVLGGGGVDPADSARLPAGVRDPKVQTLGARFLDLMRRLDSDVQVTGDRYARAFHYAGALLAELQLRDGGLCVCLPDGAGGESRVSWPLRTPDDARQCADLVMRRYLEISGDDRPVNGASLASVSPPSRAPEPAGAANLSLERLRATVETTRLSPEEYSVLGETGPDDHDT